MQKTMPVAVLALLLAAGVAKAQEAEAKPPAKPKPATPLKVQVVFSRYEAEKKVASLVYSLPVNADDSRSRLHMGIQVPLKYETKDGGGGNVVFKNAGNSIACGAEAVGDGRFKLNCSFDQSSVYSSDAGSAARQPDGTPFPPVLRNFSSEATLFLRDGQSVQHTVATDPVSGELLKVDVTLTVLK